MKRDNEEAKEKRKLEEQAVRGQTEHEQHKQCDCDQSRFAVFNWISRIHSNLLLENNGRWRHRMLGAGWQTPGIACAANRDR